MPLFILKMSVLFASILKALVTISSLNSYYGFVANVLQMYYIVQIEKQLLKIEVVFHTTFISIAVLFKSCYSILHNS